MVVSYIAKREILSQVYDFVVGVTGRIEREVAVGETNAGLERIDTYLEPVLFAHAHTDGKWHLVGAEADINLLDRILGGLGEEVDIADGFALKHVFLHAEHITLLVDVDETIGVDLLQFGAGGLADVDLVAAGLECPKRVSVKPLGHLRGLEFELATFHLERAATFSSQVTAHITGGGELTLI